MDLPGAASPSASQIVEIGSYAGGSTLYFAHLLDLLGEGVVLSVDISRAEYRVQHDRVVELTSSSGDPAIVAEVTRRCRGRRTALHPTKFPERPLSASEEFLNEDARFEVDTACERYLMTWNPNGYLHRLR